MGERAETVLPLTSYLLLLPGAQLRWLERTPDKREVGGSSPLVPTKRKIEILRKKHLEN